MTDTQQRLLSIMNKQLRQLLASRTKALKLIFNKRVDIPTLNLSETVEDYNASIEEFVETAEELTKEEFDFLKAVSK